MKTRKTLVYFGLLILGTVITVTIDYLIGVSFKDVGLMAHITHKVTYMVWGGAIFSVVKWLH